MKNTLLFTLLLTFGIMHQSSFAQEVEVHMGKEYKKGKKEFIHSVHRENGKTIAIKTDLKIFGSNDLYLETFDEDLNRTNRNELEFPDKDLVLSSVRYVNGEIFLFMEKFDKRNKENTVYGTKISEKGKFENEIFEIIKFKLEKRRKINDFFISLSEDSTKFLIQSTPPLLDKDQKAQRHFMILDLDFQEVDNIELELNYDERDFRINSTLLDHKGNIHMLTSVVIPETRKKSLFNTSLEREARIFTLYKGENELEEYEIDFDNDDAGFISQIKLGTDDLGRFKCAGFYSDKKGNSTKGVFVFTVDVDTKELSNVSTQEFTDEYLNQFLSDRQIRKKERKKKRNAKNNPYDKLYNYKIRNLVMKDGGGFYIIAEYYYYYVTTTTNSNGGTTTTHHYHYDDLMVINVMKDNSVDWYARVPKLQHTVNDGGKFSSIVSGLNKDNSLNILYNDHVKNANSLDPERLKNMRTKKSTVVLVKFDKDGNATKTPLFNQRKKKIYLIPSASPEGKASDIILYSIGKRKNRLTNIVLK